jgi:hypothetical protein
MNLCTKLFAMPALGGLVFLGGLIVSVDTADAKRLGRGFTAGVAVGASKAANRSSRASERESREDGPGGMKTVDHEARAREAKAKLEAEAAGETPLLAPVASANPLPVEARKAVCVAGCY